MSSLRIFAAQLRQRLDLVKEASDDTYGRAYMKVAEEAVQRRSNVARGAAIGASGALIGAGMHHAMTPSLPSAPTPLGPALSGVAGPEVPSQHLRHLLENARYNTFSNSLRDRSDMIEHLRTAPERAMGAPNAGLFGSPGLTEHAWWRHFTSSGEPDVRGSMASLGIAPKFHDLKPPKELMEYLDSHPIPSYSEYMSAHPLPWE